MANVLGAREYCTRDPHFEGKEIFGFCKRMANLPLELEHDSHHPNLVNFSQPRVGRRSILVVSSRALLDY